MKHWSESDFLNKLYDLDTSDQHLEGCPKCKAKFDQWNTARKQLLNEREVPASLLNEQRAQIMQSIVAPSRKAWLKWVPAAALAGIAIFAVVNYFPRQQPVVVSEAQLMADIYRSAFDAEPSSVAPIRGLFETKPAETKQ